MNQAALIAPDLRYPIGRPVKISPPLDEAARKAAIADVAELPARLRTAVAGLDEKQLNSPYREGGWTVRQLVHHVADSHANAHVRVRLALTEDWPTIKPYREADWVELHDARTLPVEISLTLLEQLHHRWVALLRSLDEAQWARGYVHPDNGPQGLEAVLALYSWHSRHHTAHIAALRKRMGW